MRHTLQTLLVSEMKNMEDIGSKDKIKIIGLYNFFMKLGQSRPRIGSSGRDSVWAGAFKRDVTIGLSQVTSYGPKKHFFTNGGNQLTSFDPKI